MDFSTEAARYTGYIMAVILAVAGLLGWIVTPEDLQHITVLVTTAVSVFVALGGTAYIRAKVASRKTVENLIGKEQAAAVFRPGEDPNHGTSEGHSPGPGEPRF